MIRTAHISGPLCARLACRFREAWPEQCLCSRYGPNWVCSQNWQAAQTRVGPGSRWNSHGSRSSAGARCPVMPAYACARQHVLVECTKAHTCRCCSPLHVNTTASRFPHLEGCDEPTAVRRALAASRWRPRVALSLASASRSCRASSRCAAAALAASLASSSAMLASCAWRLATYMTLYISPDSPSLLPHGCCQCHHVADRPFQPEIKARDQPASRPRCSTRTEHTCTGREQQLVCSQRPCRTSICTLRASANIS
jgi:hypothetical protein